MENSTVIYKGHTIKIWQDEGAQNPFEMWDGNVPLMYKSGHGEKDYSDGKIAKYLAYFMTNNQIIRHQKKIADIFEIELDYFVEQEFNKNEKISDIRSEIQGNKNMSRFVYFCELAKIPFLMTSKNGYSQGDWANIFICPTDEFFEETGCNELTMEMMEDGADLWSYWAYGDAYGYTIEGFGDGCCRFYGTDPEKNGLLDYAKDNINTHIAGVRRDKIAKLKKLIFAKVSIFYRPRILAEFNL